MLVWHRISPGWGNQFGLAVGRLPWAVIFRLESGTNRRSWKLSKNRGLGKGAHHFQERNYQPPLPPPEPPEPAGLAAAGTTRIFWFNRCRCKNRRERGPEITQRIS